MMTLFVQRDGATDLTVTVSAMGEDGGVRPLSVYESVDFALALAGAFGVWNVSTKDKTH